MWVIVSVGFIVVCSFLNETDLSQKYCKQKT